MGVKERTGEREREIRGEISKFLNWCFSAAHQLVIICLFIYSFISLNGEDVAIFGECLQNLGPCSRHLIPVCEQGEIFIVPHLLSHGPSVFAVPSEGPPNLVTSYDKQGVLGTYTYPDLHDSNLSVSCTSVTTSESWLNQTRR